MSKRKGQKRCRQCREWYKPFNTLQACCSPKCALKYSKTKEGREHVAKEKRKENRAEKRRILYEENLSWWLRVGGNDRHHNGGNTATWVHAFVRLRDKDLPCIMCGSFEPKGGKWDACHYRSRGAAGHLRFHPDNIHKGCAHCNTHTNSDTSTLYRLNLVERIGEERVQVLESNNEPRKFTIDECREIRDHFKQLTKELERKQAA